MIIRISSAEDHITLYQEALLCVISCLHILKAISSHCDFEQLCHCLRNIKVSISVLSKTAVPEKEDEKSEKMKQMVVDGCEVVEKWLERKNVLSSKIPGNNITETEKELVVNIYLYNYSLV